MESTQKVDLDIEIMEFCGSHKIRTITGFINALQTEYGNKWLNSLPNYDVCNAWFVVRVANTILKR